MNAKIVTLSISANRTNPEEPFGYQGRWLAALARDSLLVKTRTGGSEDNVLRIQDEADYSKY